MNTVLVTGGAGFIGSHLCEKLLENGDKVICVDNFDNFYNPSIKRRNIKKALASPQYTLIEGDIRNRIFIEEVFRENNPNIVVHLAALAGVRKSIENPFEYIDVDINGTVSILESCKKYKVGKFIFASSSSVYGNSTVPSREDACPRLQLSPYAASKYATEQFCKTYSHLYEIPAVILRFFTVYGPRQRPEMAVSSFTSLIDQGMEIYVYGNGESARDYTYIDDIIEGIILSLNLDCRFEIINLGSSKALKLNDLISIIESRLGKYALKKFLPAHPGDAEATCADITKANKLLGYYPKTDINEGLTKFINWYKSGLP